MAYALVGAAGIPSQGVSGAAVTPSYGGGESRTAGNLLICWVAVDGSATLPSTSTTGWAAAVTKAGTSCSVGIFYKVATGADSSMTVTAITSGVIAAMVAEFSGNDSSAPADQNGSAAGTTSSQTATAAGTDAQSGQLVIGTNAAFYSGAATKTLTITMNNGATVTQADNASTSTANHYAFGRGITTGNSAADNEAFSFTTTNITGTAEAVASFKLAAAGGVTAAPTHMMMGMGA